jgi:hypothetical protein
LSLAKKFKAKQTYGLEKSENPKHAEADIRWQRIVLNDLGEFGNSVPISLFFTDLFCTFAQRVSLLAC